MANNLKDLYEDERFNKVSPDTKTDIINTIGLDITDAKEDVAQKRFSKEQLTEALHYLLASEAHEQNANVERIIVRDNVALESNYRGSAFHFGNDDPLLWYVIGYNNGRSSSGSSSLGSGSTKCDGEGAAIAVAVACACAAGCCCYYCTKETINGPDHNNAKIAKVGTSSLLGLVVFTALLIHFYKNDVWHDALVTRDHWDEGGYKFFMFLVAACSGLLTSGVISTINNSIPCLPEIPKPSDDILAALESLTTIKTLLTQGWAKNGDDKLQCDAFVREVISFYITKIAAEPNAKQVSDLELTEIKLTSPTGSIATSNFSTFSPKKPSAPLESDLSQQHSFNLLNSN